MAKIAEQIPTTYERYVEPFAGSACVFFSIRPKVALIADFNADLIHTYDVVARHPRLLARAASSFKTDEATYYRVRKLQASALDDVARAARFLYLNSYCFNGVYRTNRDGDFNVPRGSKSAGVPEEQHLVRCSIALRAASLHCHDYKNSLALCRKGDFVYLDPPYRKRGVRDRGEYGAGSFSFEDETDLIESLRNLDTRGVKFLLSYRSTASFVKKLPTDWLIQKVRVNRSVAGFAEARRSAFEVFVRNYELEC